MSHHDQEGTPLSNTGFTLLEVMIAMAILAISLTSLFGSQSSSVALATETRFNTQAPLLAQLQLARLSSASPPSTTSGDFGADFPGFQWQLTVEDAVFPEADAFQGLEGKLLHLLLIVSWGDELFHYRLESYQEGPP